LGTLGRSPDVIDALVTLTGLKSAYRQIVKEST
jgi:hypothetical protein